MEDFGSSTLEDIVQLAKKLTLASNVLNTPESIQLADITDKLNDLRDKYLERRIDEVLAQILQRSVKC